MMTSLCREFYQFLLAQGILTGLAAGLLTIPFMSALAQHFSARRSAAMGIAMAGSSVGAIVFPLVLSSLLNDTALGFAWTFRIGGFLMLPPLIFALFTVSSRLPPRRSNFFLPSAFAKPTYSLLVATSFFLLVGMFIPLVYLPAYAVQNGMSEVFASHLVAIINGASIPGRIVPGILGDRYGRINLLFIAGLATSILAFCWPEATSGAGIIVLAVFFGLASGTIISGGSVVLAQCAGSPAEVGTYMGQGFAAASASVLVALPVAGVFLRTYGGYREISLFSGAMALMGAVMAAAAKGTTAEGLLGNV
jgi:MFS family permease